MSKSRSFLNTPYGAYFAREVPPPDDELVRVGPGTPCGEYLRSFWQPVAFARDFLEVPLRIRIMGEDLVIFDSLGAGNGNKIGFSEGGEAAAPFHPEKKPVDAYCACILDQVSIKP